MSDTVSINGKSYRASRLKAAPVSGFGFGMLAGFFVFIVGAVFLIIPPIGIGVMAIGLLTMVAGPFVVKAGRCPNCTYKLLKPSKKPCPKCQHAVSAHKGWLVDFSEPVA